MSNPNNSAKSITGEEFAAALNRAIRYSDEMDSHSSAKDFERRYDRLNLFVTSLASEFYVAAPEIYTQLTGFQLRVVDEENSLRTARETAERGGK